MGDILRFQSCAVNGEFTQLGIQTPSNIYYKGITSPTNIENYLNDFYKDDETLSGKVTGIGYGWQKFVVDAAGPAKFSVRGAAGGSTGVAGYTIDPITGEVTGAGNRPGRGAKVEGKCNLKLGDILYILVGMRGWCNNGSDWGGGGGGASVVLLDNPDGNYTFSPLNRKVDVLFVAGGGGGTFDSYFGINYYGKDASYNNGTNTNAGSSNGGCGGAGLTGSSARGSGPYGSPAILSGNPATATLNEIHCGGWGGGGCSYDGGGGGGGYSGGSVAHNGTGGNGGTSYINPNLCIETFRGYATVEKDSNRNLSNPWTAYGFVEIELGRSKTKLILAKDSDGYKWFNGEHNLDGSTNSSFSNRWELLPTQEEPTQIEYNNYGKTMIINTIGLQSKVKFLVSSKNANENIYINGNVNGTIVKSVNDCNVSQISNIQSSSIISSLNNVIINFAISKDYGSTWQTYNSGAWVDIDITNKTEFQTDGYDLNQFTAIPISDWDTYLNKTKNIKFAFCITQYGPTSSSLVESMKFIVDLTGSWKKYSESDATYEYISDDQLKVTFLREGNYKVNYLDKLVSKS